MSTDRDDALDAWLGRSADRSAGPTPACLDAETAAAWLDGTLSHDDRAAAEAHASGCVRCQALLAALTVSADAPAAAPAGARTLRWLAWTAPLAAAAVLVVAVTIWRRTPQPPPEPQIVTAVAPREEAIPQPGADQGQVIIGGAGRVDTPQPNETLTRQEQRVAAAEPVPSVPDAPPPAAPRAPSPAAAARRFTPQALAAPPRIEIVSPDPSVRWRIQGTTVERSADGGRSWNSSLAGAIPQLTAGSSPSPTTCWIVGRGGTVLVTADGTTWSRRDLSPALDLVAVTGSGPLEAVVTAADGRRFSTVDGGILWREEP